MAKDTTVEKITSLAKRRGFVYPSSDLYGGLANSWDLGHYGTLLKNNLRDYWWKKFVTSRRDMVGIDASIILKPEIWEASGHKQGFNDALIDCRNCRNRMRADHLIEDKTNIKAEGLSFGEMEKVIADNKIKCPKCGQFDWTPIRKFNQLVEVRLGTLEEGKQLAYLRGEIAQGIFLNFKNVTSTMRVRLPFGIAQQGKAFRNEITMGQFIHRTFEFELMEFEYFIRKEEWEKKYEYWSKEMWQWVLDLGISEENIRWREHSPEERSHYSKKTMDIEYKYPSGWKEMFGLAYRTDYDLSSHAMYTGKDLQYTDPVSGEKFYPHVIEPTFGLSRLTGIVLFDAYREESVGEKTRIYLKIHPRIAPVKAAVFPLQKDAKLREKANEIYSVLKQDMVTEFDDSGNIGKMYRRQDEIGTPYCLTIDYQTLEDGTVTVRERDSMKQERIKTDKIREVINSKIT